MSTRDFSEQEQFWATGFGDDYIGRNQGEELLAAKSAFFARALSRTGQPVGSALELGANVGLNLRALRHLLPQAELSGVEINAAAHEQLGAIDGVDAHHGSILDFRPGRRWDLVFTVGVLIHIPPEDLDSVYDTISACASRYVLINEYYNPTPLEIGYRGHDARLWKRDFAGELLDRDPALRLVDYGFVYRRDPNFPLDDVTWFLLERSA